MNFDEQVLVFACEGESLTGILALPETPLGIGVVVIVGGPQYRAGSHRQFVELARRTASEGFPVLRFDYRGMGDSSGELRGFEAVEADVSAAIAEMQRACPGVREVVLWGLCDGASAALLYVDHPRPDERVVGLCLLNPWVRTPETLARAHVRHYYLDRLRQPDFWSKLVRGRIALQAAREMATNVALMLRLKPTQAGRSDAEPAYKSRMARGWMAFSGVILLFLSGRDYTAKEFEQALESDVEWRLAMVDSKVERVDLPDADHTLSDRECRISMESRFLDWLRKLAVRRGAGAAAEVAAATKAGSTHVA